MASASDTDSDEALSQSCPDTELGLPEQQPPESPPLAKRRTFSHYTQVRHNGYLTKRFKNVGASARWSRQFCTVHGNILRCFASKRHYTDTEDPVETNIIRGVRPWQAEFNKPYNRGLLIDCEGGDTIITRTDTAAEQEEWTEALRTVTELLGNAAGGGFDAGADSDDGSDDGDTGEFGAGSGRIQTTYLKQKEALLTPAEASGPCTVVFQVAKTTLQRIDDADVGTFNNGDVYLVMHAVHDPSAEAGTARELTRTLFYWVGSKASMDKGTVACIKAVELRRALPGPCSIRREDEGQESPEFLVLFDEVTVAEDESGARVLSKVKRWNEHPPIMYSVRMRSPIATSATETVGGQQGRGIGGGGTGSKAHRKPLHSSFTLGRIDLDEDQLGSERVLLVDDRNGHIYLWCGNMSTFKHRGFGLEAATRVKADSPKGGQVVQVDEDDEPPELRRILDRARKQRLLELQVRAAEADDNGAEEEGAEQRRMSLMGAGAEGAGPAVSLFRVTQAQGSLQLSLVACTSRQYISEIGGDELEPEEDGPPMLSMLDGDAAFILDVFTEVFVWYGGDAPRTVRIGAGKVASQLVQAVARPPWAEEITHVREAREPFLFRVKFFDWGVSPRGQARGPVNDMSSFLKTVRTIAELRPHPEEEVRARAIETLRRGMDVDLPAPQDASVAAAGAGADQGYGELLMWRVHQRGLIAVPEEEFGHMHSTNSYVFLYGFDAAGDEGSDDGDTSTDGEGSEGGDGSAGGGQGDEDERDSDSSDDHDSVLSSIDVRDAEDNSEGGRQKSSSSRTNGAGGGSNGRGKRRKARGAAGGSSRRKTMFAEMKRESMAGTLKQVSRGGRRQRRSVGDQDEGLQKMTILSENEEGGGDGNEDSDDDDDDDDDDEEEESEEEERGRRKSRLLSSSSYGARSSRAASPGQLSDDLSEMSATSDEADGEGDRGDEEGGSSSEEGAASEPRFLIYFWAGARAKKSDWVLWKLELAKSMIPEWQKVVDYTIPQVQMVQGQEPLHFRRLFGQGRDHGRLIVHDRVWRKRDNPEKRVSLFKVQRMPDGEFQAFQVPPCVGSFDSMDVFVCICTVVTDDWVGNNDEAVFFWVGKHATISLQEHGAKVLMALMEYYCMPADFKVQILEEEELYDDHAQLWDDLSEMLGGEVTWAHWNDVWGEDFDADDDLGCVPKLYVADSGSGDVELCYLGHIQRECLISETVAVLDTDEGVYVWRGAKADVSQHRLVYKACEAYCQSKPLEVGRRVIGVQENQEPPVFRARFQAWDEVGPGQEKKFEDVYEKRVVQMTQEGKLGDMSALRGRVLGDEEAAQYWDKRGSEPGGQGVKSGVFRDDPASRSTQRRGAPGRKAWVKPPPKPKPDHGKAKELEARRNFLALKERFEGGSNSEAFANKPKKAFSRESLLQARKESIAKGHATRFKETAQPWPPIASTDVLRRYATANGGGVGAAAAGADEVVRGNISAADWESERRRSSWESSSSARRRHAASMKAEAEAKKIRKSLEAAAREAEASKRGSFGRGSRRSDSGSFGWDANEDGRWQRRASSDSFSPGMPSGANPAQAAMASAIGARDSAESRSSWAPAGRGTYQARPSLDSAAESHRYSSSSGVGRRSDSQARAQQSAANRSSGARAWNGRPSTEGQAVAKSRWSSGSSSSGSSSGDLTDRDSFEAQSLPRRDGSDVLAGYRRPRSRSRSGSIVDNEGLLEALEQAEKMERRRSSIAAQNSARASTASGRPSWARQSSSSSAEAEADGESSLGRRSDPAGNLRRSVGGRSSAGGGDSSAGAEGNEGRGVSEYQRALARVRRETIEEGRRHGQARERDGVPRHQRSSDRRGLPDDEDYRRAPRHPVSLKHAMSRVKDHTKPSRLLPPGTTSTPRAISDSSPRDARTPSAAATPDGSRFSTGSAGSFNDADYRDVDSPRNRGRQYDDRWKMPGHAESVLASFVERLEHRGHHGHTYGGNVAGESSAAAALQEARANRGAAIAVLSNGGRSGGGATNQAAGEKSAQGRAAVPSAVVPSRRAAAAAPSRRRRSGSNGGGTRGGPKVGGRVKNGEWTARRDSRGRANGSSPKLASERSAGARGGAGGGSGGMGAGGAAVGVGANGSGTWSKIGGMFHTFQQAIAGIPKDEDGEGTGDEKHWTAEIARTRDAATTFLSNTRRLQNGDQE